MSAAFLLPVLGLLVFGSALQVTDVTAQPEAPPTQLLHSCDAHDRPVWPDPGAASFLAFLCTFAAIGVS